MIEIREADLGPVVARADHQDNAIEVNTEIFYKLPPMVQEFVLCHEVCHLQYDEHDEATTNSLASEVFLKRSANEADRKKRENFLSYMSDKDYSNFAWATLFAAIPALITLGATAYTVYKSYNSGWYAMDNASRASFANALLKDSFEKARRSSKISAAEFFWDQMKNYTQRDSTLEGFLNRSANNWVGGYIRQYEKRYGFGFYEVTPVDIFAYPVAVIAIGAAVGFVIYKLIKKTSKK